MKQPKEYKFKLPDTVLNFITEDNLDNFLEGLKFSLSSYLTLIKVLRKQGYTGKNTDIVKSKNITYIDDGKQNNSIDVTVKIS